MALGDVVVRASGVKKDFHLPHHKSNSIKHILVNALKKKDKSVDVHHALKGVSFEVREGEFFGIVGRNGSGKSTMLKILAQIYQPKSGKVWHHGKLVSFIELGVGFNGELTGRENIYLNGALLGFSRKEIDERYDEIVAFSELEEFMDQKLKNYSSGMKVRLAFSVATHAEADILLLDEVLAVGDAAFQRKCYDYFKDLKKRKKTIIFVSHSMGAVREYCDRAILIEDGLIAHQGSADEIADEYLKLFNKPTDDKKQSSDRWGSGEVQFTSITADITEDELIVTMKLKGNADLDEVVIGMDIYNEKHSDQKVLTTGIDERPMREHHFSIKKGEKKTIRYVFKNMFGGGSYTLTSSLKTIDGSYIYDFWRDAASFTDPKQASEYFPSLYPVEVQD